MKMTPLRLVHKWCQHINSGNISELMSLYGKNSILMPTFSDKIITTKDEMIEYFKIFEKKEVRLLTSKERESHREVSNIIHGEYDFLSRSSSHKARYTFVFGVENSDWKIVCHHSSLIPNSSRFSMDFYKYVQRCNRYAEVKI